MSRYRELNRKVEYKKMSRYRELNRKVEYKKIIKR